jgi:DDE superfamily endonuclease
MGVIPPAQSGEVVAHMEDVLEVYHQPYDPQVPLVCMDEQPVQLIKEIRKPLPAKAGQPERFDDEYERHGTATIFMFTEPLRGVRMVSVREHKTAVDWAMEVQQLLDRQYPEADRIRLVCDNLNTHGIGSLYEAFPPEQARRLASRLDLHHTPKHGRWLNIAELERRALTLPCLDRRIPDLETLREETRQWEQRRNASQKGVDWQFSTHEARIKLKRLYPQMQS